MFVTAEELELVNSGARTAMLLPVLRGTMGQRRACIVEYRQVLGLQCRVGVKGTKVTIVERVALTMIGNLDETHGRELGYKTLEEALRAYESQQGRLTAETEAWVARFKLGDLTETYLKHDERYLASKGSRLTTDPDKAAPGEGAVPYEEEMKFAREAAEKRSMEASLALGNAVQAIRAQIATVEGVKGELSEPARKDLEWMRRRAEKMAKQL